MISNYLETRQFRKIVQEYPHKVKTYEKVKWLQIQYNKGDHLLLEFNSNIGKKVPKVVKLIQIYSVEDGEMMIPLIEVQYFVFKEELCQKIRDRYSECFSDAELFLTEETDVLFIDCLARSVKVISYQEYETVTPAQYLYFTRAKYHQEQLDPPIETWEKWCVCQKPLNPDRAYILCDECQQWFHMDCMKISQIEADQTENYVCLKCQKIQLE